MKWSDQAFRTLLLRDHSLSQRIFEILGSISDVETIGVGRRIREIDRLRRVYGPGRWRKRKGTARVRLPDGTVSRAEVHWYEAHGVGRKEIKIKRLLAD